MCPYSFFPSFNSCLATSLSLPSWMLICNKQYLPTATLIHNHITVLDTTMTTGHRLTVSTNLQYRHQSSLCLPSFDTAAIYLFVSSVPAHREQDHTQSDQIFQHGCGFTYKNCFVLICDSTRTSRSVIRLSWLSSELGKKGTHLALFPDTPYRPIIC